MNIDEELDGIIDAYDHLVRGIDKKAKADNTRAYGGVIRASKGKLVENIARHLVGIAWDYLGEPIFRLHMDNRKIKVPLRKDYINRIKDPKIQNYIAKNIDRYYFPAKLDFNVYINQVLALAVECKAFTENAMIKRVLFDSTLIKEIYPDTEFVLLQLENQLGGDYGPHVDKPLGSYSTHTLMSFFNIDLKIITLVEGGRLVNAPIHKAEYYKPLEKQNLVWAVHKFADILKKYQ